MKYLREVLPFKTSQGLVQQMKKDVERAREALDSFDSFRDEA